MLGDIGKDEVRGDRRDLIQARFAELALHVILGGKAESAVELEARIRRFPRSFGGQEQRHVGFGATPLLRIKKAFAIGNCTP
jgi:hypothetical protein